MHNHKHMNAYGCESDGRDCPGLSNWKGATLLRPNSLNDMSKNRTPKRGLLVCTSVRKWDTFPWLIASLYYHILYSNNTSIDTSLQSLRLRVELRLTEQLVSANECLAVYKMHLLNPGITGVKRRWDLGLQSLSYFAFMNACSRPVLRVRPTARVWLIVMMLYT